MICPICITGSPSAGKSTVLRILSVYLEEKGVKVLGFVQPPVFSDGNKAGYDLLVFDGNPENKQKKQIPLARRSLVRKGYEFDSDAFEMARRTLSELHESAQSPTWFIDELGKLESEGKGHMPNVIDTMERTMEKSSDSVIWTMSVRRDSIQKILDLLPFENWSVFLDLDTLTFKSPELGELYGECEGKMFEKVEEILEEMSSDNVKYDWLSKDKCKVAAKLLDYCTHSLGLIP